MVGIKMATWYVTRNRRGSSDSSQYDQERTQNLLLQISGIGMINDQVMENPPALASTANAVSELHQHLVQSLGLRVLDIPVPPGAINSDARLAVLFSGGLDCTMLARITSDVLPAAQPIDLINVAFENPRIASQNKSYAVEQLYELCPDRITGRKSFAELVKMCPGRRWRFVTVCLLPPSLAAR